MIERSIASYARTPQTNMNQFTLAKLNSPMCRIHFWVFEPPWIYWTRRLAPAPPGCRLHDSAKEHDRDVPPRDANRVVAVALITYRAAGPVSHADLVYQVAGVKRPTPRPAFRLSPI